MVEAVAKWNKFHFIDYLIDKCELKEEFCFPFIDTTLLHIEKSSIVKLSYRRTMITLHIIGIAFLSVGVYLLVDAGLWFSTLMAFLILLAIAVHLYRLQMMQVRMMRHLAESLRYDDMMLSFRSPYKNRSMEDMVDELSEAMRNFRTRVLERNEMEEIGRASCRERV